LCFGWLFARLKTQKAKTDFSAEQQKMDLAPKVNGPQRLKPRSKDGIYGTAEALPLSKTGAFSKHNRVFQGLLLANRICSGGKATLQFIKPRGNHASLGHLLKTDTYL
jgi:hypothetical protein